MSCNKGCPRTVNLVESFLELWDISHRSRHVPVFPGLEMLSLATRSQKSEIEAMIIFD